jgi:hypothetical protein
MYEYMLKNGMTKQEYLWFAENQVKARCIMGNDYYVTNEHLVFPDGHTQAAGENLRILCDYQPVLQALQASHHAY